MGRVPFELPDVGGHLTAIYHDNAYESKGTHARERLKTALPGRKQPEHQDSSEEYSFHQVERFLMLSSACDLPPHSVLSAYNPSIFSGAHMVRRSELPDPTPATFRDPPGLVEVSAAIRTARHKQAVVTAL